MDIIFLYNGRYEALKRQGLLDYMVSLRAACMHLQPLAVMLCISLAHCQAHLPPVQGAANLHPVEWYIRFKNMPEQEPPLL